MAQIWIIYSQIIIVALLATTQAAEQNDDELLAEVMVTDSESSYKVQVGNTFNITSEVPQTATIMQQGNNFFIKPKIILGSRFATFKQDSRGSQRISMTSNVSGEQTNITIIKSEEPQIATIPVPASMSVTTSVDGKVSVFPPKISSQPIVIPNACQSIPCPPYIFPVSPNFPNPSKFPILIEKNITSFVIPKPPRLPPIVLPKLPIEVVVHNPIVPILDHTIFVQSICTPMVRCITNERDLLPAPNTFGRIFRNFKNLLTNIDLTRLFLPDTPMSPTESPVTIPSFPTLCAQGIIIERFVPNIVKEDDVKVFVSPISSSQFVINV